MISVWDTTVQLETHVYALRLLWHVSNKFNKWVQVTEFFFLAEWRLHNNPRSWILITNLVNTPCAELILLDWMRMICVCVCCVWCTRGYAVGTCWHPPVSCHYFWRRFRQVCNSVRMISLISIFGRWSLTSNLMDIKIISTNASLSHSELSYYYVFSNLFLFYIM